jgi:hypothetical protein
MTGSVDIAMHNAGNENVDRSNVAVNFCVFQYAYSGARVFAADYIQPNMPVNVYATGKAQKVSINMR